MKTDYDVIIVGAGPAGASCAKYLVDNGVKTLVIENRKLPRYKCCSGLYSKRAIDFIKDNFEDFPQNLYCKNQTVSLKIRKKSNHFFHIPKFTFKNLRREEVDYWLIKQSKVNIYDNCMMVNFEKVGNKKRIQFKYNNKNQYITCNYLIGADGASSKIGKLLGFNYSSNGVGFAVQNVYQGDFHINDRYYYITMTKEFAEIFSWFNIKDDLLYIGTGWYKSNNYYTKWFDSLQKKYNFSLRLLRKEACFTKNYIGSLGYYFGDNDTLLIGSATGIVAPFSEGIPSALITGKEAAKAIINNNGSILKRYKENIKSELVLVEGIWQNTKLY